MQKLFHIIKHKILLPLTRRLGFGEEFVASLRLPTKVRKALAKSSTRNDGKTYAAPMTNATTIAGVIDALCEGLSVDAAIEWSARMKAIYPEKAFSIEWAMPRGLSRFAPEKAMEEAERLLTVIEKDDLKSLRALSSFFLKMGRITRSIEVLEMSKDREGVSVSLERLRAQKELLENGYPIPKKSGKQQITSRSNAVMYLLHNSLPYDSGGYATRAHGLAKGALRNGWQLDCVTRLGYPRDMGVFAKMTIPRETVIDDIHYYRALSEGNPYRDLNSREYLKRNSEAVEALARKIKPEILHGASNHINGLAANQAARVLGLKAIYEVRGLWELTRMSRQPIYGGSEHYRMAERLEVEACNNSDAVITITGALKDFMVDRGVDSSKIVVIPNGVDTQRFKPVPPDEALESRLGIKGKTVIGFVGSMPDYEGLEYLVRAVRLLLDEGLQHVHLLLVGDGDSYQRCKAISQQLGLDDHVTFTGRVPHHQVESYYSLIDVAAFPRKRQPVTEIVSPLKPFEAMAMGIPVVASDVAAMKEFVFSGVNGQLFEADDVEGLASALRGLIDNDSLRSALGGQAREWVVRERDWQTLGRQLVDIYESL